MMMRVLNRPPLPVFKVCACLVLVVSVSLASSGADGSPSHGALKKTTVPVAQDIKAAPKPQPRRMGEKAPTTGTYEKLRCQPLRIPPRHCRTPAH